MPKIVKDEEIYRAVIRVVGERGYAGATTKQMAEAANVSEVTLFRKYENKNQLIKQAITAIIAQTDFATASRFTGDISADLLRVVQAYQDSAVKHGQMIFILLSEMPRYPELVELLDAPYQMYTGIGELITRYQVEGVLRKEHSLHAVSALLGPLIYATMMRSAMPSAELPPLDLSHHVNLFLEGRRV